MGWDGLYLNFDSEEEIRDYMAARLSGSDTTQPPVAVDRGVSPEDVLIAYYRRNQRAEDKRTWFWNSWGAVVAHAWQGKELETFRNGVSLATGVKPPVNADEWTGFLPREPDAYVWDDPGQYEILENALALLDAWELVERGGDFWETAFRNCVRQLPISTERLPPVITAYNGLGHLDDQHIDELLRYTVKAGDIATGLLGSILDDLKYSCHGDGECEIGLLVSVGMNWSVVALSLPTSRETGRNQPNIKGTLQEFLASSWSDTAASEKGRFGRALARKSNENPARYATAVVG